GYGPDGCTHPQRFLPDDDLDPCIRIGVDRLLAIARQRDPKTTVLEVRSCVGGAKGRRPSRFGSPELDRDGRRADDRRAVVGEIAGVGESVRYRNALRVSALEPEARDDAQSKNADTSAEGSYS